VDRVIVFDTAWVEICGFNADILRAAPYAERIRRREGFADPSCESYD
jgi:hypothetical protein